MAMRVPGGRKRAKPVLSSDDSEIELVEPKCAAADSNDGGRGGAKKSAAAPICLTGDTDTDSGDADVPLLERSSVKKPDACTDRDGLQIPRGAQGECGGEICSDFCHAILPAKR